MALIDVVRQLTGPHERPTAQMIPPHELHSGIIDSLHHAVRAHPNPGAKATFGKMLAMALAEQAKAHAAGPVASGSAAGGALSPEDNGAPAGQVLAMPPPVLHAGVQGAPGDVTGVLPHLSAVQQVLALLASRPSARMVRGY